MKNNKKKGAWKQYIYLGMSILVGGICGCFIAFYMEFFINEGLIMNHSFFILVGVPLLMIVAFYLQMIIHEAGHLLFGLCTGYRFLSFRIGNLMWVKQDEKLKLRRLKITGTGGQCLMAPPNMKDGKFLSFYIIWVEH